MKTKMMMAVLCSLVLAVLYAEAGTPAAVGHPAVAGGEVSRNTETEFSLSIAGKKRVVTGTVSVESDSAQTRIVLSPRSPDWAVPRGVVTTLTGDGVTLIREAVIVNGE